MPYHQSNNGYEGHMGKSKQFETLDIYLASFFSLHGIPPVLDNRNGKIVFTFEASDDLYRLLNRYNSNQHVCVGDFVTTVKTLRGKMLTAKESITGNGKGERNGYRKV
jgi:hypothetical protein